MIIFSAIKNNGKMKKWSIGTAICFVVFIGGIFMPNAPVTSPAVVSSPQKTPEQIATENSKVKQDDAARVAALSKEKADADAKIKAEEEAKNLPKVNFSGSVDPAIAQKGDKVLIKVDVENLDESKSIDGIKLLFSDKKFLEQGLIIVNVMSGGVQDGRAFNWKSEATNIPPKGKRSYQIVAQANTPGTYESIIQVESPSFQIYSDPEGNSELSAKLVVLN